jgi:hypothetical protein
VTLRGIDGACLASKWTSPPQPSPSAGVKKGTPATHPLRGNELRALRKLQRESAGGPFLFVSERGAPFTTAGFA